MSHNAARLYRLALLYAIMEHPAEDVSSGSETERTAQRLLRRAGGAAESDVRSAVDEAFEEVSSGDPAPLIRRAAEELSAELSMGERQAVLGDLERIARSGGTLRPDQAEQLRMVAGLWGVSVSNGDGRRPDERWGVLHDLSYIYLVLAHSTDNDLSDTEMQVMLNKLREWQPEAPPETARRMLRLAMDEYAAGEDMERLEAAIASVRHILPRTQRMAALNDLVKIANADGVFLDDEEDLINRLQAEWDVDPSANYEPHADKSRTRMGG